MRPDDSRSENRRVLLICSDVIGANMAGPGMRYWEFARTLGRRLAVTLAVPPIVPMEQDALPDASQLPAAIHVC